MLVVAEYSLQFLHLGAKFARRFVCESLEIVDEVGLVGVTKFVGQISEVCVWLKHQAASNGFKPDGSRQCFGRNSGCVIKLPLELARRHMAAVGQFCHSELTFGVVKQLC